MKYSMSSLREILLSYQVKNSDNKSEETHVIEIKEILKTFKFESEDSLLPLILDLLEHEILNVNFNNFEQTLQIFSNSSVILNMFIEQYDKKKIISESMEKIDKTIKQLSKSIESAILKKGINNISKITKKITDKCKISENEYSLLKTAIYDVKRPRFLRRMIDAFPELANSKNEDSLFSEVLDDCLSLITSGEIEANYNEFLYFQYIVNIFLDSQVLKIDKKYKNKIISTISYVRKNCNFNKEHIIYLLEKILKKINNEYIYSKQNYEQKGSCNEIKIEKNNNQKIEGVDLTKLYTLTIDGEEAVLLDDAISLEIIDSKYCNLYVHVTDVWNTVPCKSPIPMNEYSICGSNEESHLSISSLPYGFFYKNCSLFKGNDRACFTLKFLIDNEGIIHRYDILKSHIISDMRMRIIDFNTIINNSNKEIYELVKKLYELSSIIRENRLSNRFESVNTETSNKGQMTVQELMILVNHYIAKPFQEKSLPFSYCAQDYKNMQDIMNILKSKINNPSNSNLIEGFIKMDLEGMYYSSTNTSHKNLCLDVYSTFTKPMINYLCYINQGPVNDLLIGNPTDERIIFYQQLYAEILPKLNEIQMLDNLYSLQKRKEESIAETTFHNEKVRRK